MGQEIAVRQETNIATGFVTPYSMTSLLALVPDWLGNDLFEPERYSLPQIIPENGPRQLRAAAERFMDSLHDFPERRFLGERLVDGQTKRMFDDPLDFILGEMRLRTIPRNESGDEARGRFRLLRDDCRRHATEVVREAALAYAAKNKFFPAGYSEFRPYILAAENTRSRRAYNLRKLAKEAEEIAAKKLTNDDPADPAEVAALVAELQAKAGISANDGKRKDYSNLQTPTADELAALAAELSPTQGVGS